MARKRAAPPPQEVRQYLMSKDGWLWWNPQVATHRSYRHDVAIRQDTNNSLATVSILGRTYRVSRLNYWFHTGEWPDNVIHKDHNQFNNQFSNLMPANNQQCNYHRQFDRRTYSITEYVTKEGKRSYFPLINIDGSMKVIGNYSSEDDAITAAIAIRKILHGEYLAQDLKKEFSNLKQKAQARNGQ